MGQLQRTAFSAGRNFAFEVTRDAIDRALLIGDTLIKALERQGMKVWVDREKSRTLIELDETSLTIAISEHVARSKHEVTAAEKKQLNAGNVLRIAGEPDTTTQGHLITTTTQPEN